VVENAARIRQRLENRGLPSIYLLSRGDPK
jgi:hypothetical protein